MKRTLGLFCFLVAAVLLLGWMLATPATEINHARGVGAVADGTSPTPPPPFSHAIMLADGTSPTPPPPFSQTEGMMVADGTSPTPPPPFSQTGKTMVADGTSPTPPPPFSLASGAIQA